MIKRSLTRHPQRLRVVAVPALVSSILTFILACGCSACTGVEYTHDYTCVWLQCLRWCRVYSRLYLHVVAVPALVSSILTIILACGCSACAGVEYTHVYTCMWLQCLHWCRVYSRLYLRVVAVPALVSSILTFILACGCSACTGVEYTHDYTCVWLQCLHWCRVYSRLYLRVVAVPALVSSILTIILACGCSACTGVEYTHDDTCVCLQCLHWC